jgi:hypothetical protein
MMTHFKKITIFSNLNEDIQALRVKHKKYPVKIDDIND